MKNETHKLFVFRCSLCGRIKTYTKKIERPFRCPHKRCRLPTSLKDMDIIPHGFNPKRL